MTEINWSSLLKEAESAGVMPDGLYEVVIVESFATRSKNGKDMIKLKLRVASGPHMDKPLWDQLVISAESGMAMRMFFLKLEAFGISFNFFETNPSMEVLAGALMNRQATADVTHDEWGGAMRNKVKGYKAVSNSGPVAPGVVTGSPIAPSAANAFTPPVPVASNPSTPPNNPF